MAILTAANLTSSDGTTQATGLGTEFLAAYGAIWVYGQVDSATTIVAGDLVQISDTGTLLLATSTTAATAVARCGVAQFAGASSEYMWVARGPFYLREDGTTTFKVLAAAAVADVVLYTTATGGVVDDASGGGAIKVSGLWLTASSAGPAVLTACQAADRLSVNI